MKQTNKLRFFGDFTTGENYQAKYENEFRQNILRQKGYDYIMKDVSCFFENSYNVLNLESPITDSMVSSLEAKKAILHWMDPQVAGNFLKKYNIDAVSIGNNHGYDYEDKGLRQTIAVLDSVKIGHFGAGLDIQNARKPLLQSFEIGNRLVNVYIFGGYKYREDYDTEFNFYAKENKSGVFLLTPETVEGEIKSIKENDPNSIIVMFPHFGFDLNKTVDHQVEYAKKWIDFGADFVIGHGPHMINKIEYYKDKPIVYSIGNFVFPANFRGRMTPYNLIAELEIKEDMGQIKVFEKLYPIYFDTFSNAPVTRPIEENEIDEVIRLLSEDSETVNNRIKVIRGEVICIEL